MNVVVLVGNFVQKSNPFRRRVFVVGDPMIHLLRRKKLPCKKVFKLREV
jgi:hypothetical protein